MGEMNCEKGESCCFLHMTTPCATSNLLSLWDQPNFTTPHQNTVWNNFFNGWKVVQVQTYHWANYYRSGLNNFCQRITWWSLSKSLTKARTIQTNVRRDEFWDTCVNFMYMVELVLVSSKAFDGKQPCMGRVWLIMKHWSDMFYHHKIHYLNCHQTLQMWLKINFIRGGRCWQSIYIM
jgi:hypothetical protein